MATSDNRRRRRLPTDVTNLNDFIARFSDEHEHLKPGPAADAILAEYYVSRGTLHQLARGWLFELIDRHRRPEAYAADEEC